MNDDKYALKYLITTKKYKVIKYFLTLYKNEYTSDVINKIHNYVILSDDDNILYIFKEIFNINWKIILNKLEYYYKYDKICKLILANKLVMNVYLMDNYLFIKLLNRNNNTNMYMLDIIIKNDNQDKIKIYCNNVILTDELFELIIDKYIECNIHYIINKITKITDNILNIIIKNKKSEYLDIIITKCSHENINTILKYSLLTQFQYGIDHALINNADYLLILNEIKKI